MSLLRAASDIAESVLFPCSLEVDGAARVPEGHLRLLAEAGLYGIETAGLAPADRWLIAEILASGCLATAFVWIQHHGAVRGLLASENHEMCDRWLEPLTSGARRAGIAIGGVRAPVPSLRASPATGGWRLDGTVPWVTGWGLIDVMLTGAVVDDREEVWALIPAQPGVGVEANRYRLVAADASSTVALTFTGVFVPDELVVGVVPHTPPPANDGGGRNNGSFALGIARRACLLMGPSPIDAQLDAMRTQLDVATDDEMATARAGACELAFRATARLVVHAGSRSLGVDHHAQMLARQAQFAAVFGTRPAIREGLMKRLSQAGSW
ncbi:MAG: acyl-CoA dehydrogenase family protein [Acidimicrobiia bacterium]